MKRVLIYVGYQHVPFNHDTVKTTGLDDSELAVYYLAKKLADIGYDVTIGGEVIDSEEDSLKFKSLATLRNERGTYDTVISSSYIHYLIELQDYISFNKSFLWVHNEEYYESWEGIKIPDSGRLLSSPNLNGVVCLSKTHARKFAEKYGFKNPYYVIGYGIDYSSFSSSPSNKNPNLFVYRGSAKNGLSLVLTLWESIKKHRPESILRVFCPSHEIDEIKKYNIKQEGVIIHGDEPNHIVNMWFQIASYWIQPDSKDVMFSQTALNAQYSMCIPIVQDCDIFSENILYGIRINHNGMSDEKEIAALYLNEILKLSPLDVGRMNRNNFNWVKNITWDSIATKWSKLIR